jgi:hypothetical protein
MYHGPTPPESAASDLVSGRLSPDRFRRRTLSKPIEPEHVLLEFYTLCSFHPDTEPAQPIPLFVLGFREGSEPVFIWLVDKNHFDGSRLTKDAYWQQKLDNLEEYMIKKLSKCVAEENSVHGGIELLVSTYQNQLRFSPLTPVADHPFGLRKGAPPLTAVS